MFSRASDGFVDCEPLLASKQPSFQKPLSASRPKKNLGAQDQEHVLRAPLFLGMHSLPWPSFYSISADPPNTSVEILSESLSTVDVATQSEPTESLIHLSSGLRTVIVGQLTHRRCQQNLSIPAADQSTTSVPGLLCSAESPDSAFTVFSGEESLRSCTSPSLRQSELTPVANEANHVPNTDCQNIDADLLGKVSL